MKRFIDLRDQIQEGTKEFAFFDTVTGQFEQFGISMTFETKRDFIDQYDGNQLGRYLVLIPDGW